MKPILNFAPFVSRQHGDVFAEIVVEGLRQSDTSSEAFGSTKIICWPGGDDNGPAVERYHDVADEICNLVFELTRQHLAETFATVATIVLNRERDR